MAYTSMDIITTSQTLVRKRDRSIKIICSYFAFIFQSSLALHQVFRFNIKNSTQKPDLVLGDPFKPSMTSKTFCKPTSVVQLENGDFFVADGYCNARIIKFNFKGEKILEVIFLLTF